MSGFAPLTDTTTGRSSKWDATNSAAHVNLSTLISGENQTLNVLETITGGTEYQAAAFASSADVTLGAVGAAGDYLDTITIKIGVASVTAVTIKDGTTTITALSPATTTDNSVLTIPVRAKSKNGAWKIAITATTYTTVSYFATGLFT